MSALIVAWYNLQQLDKFHRDRQAEAWICCQLSMWQTSGNIEDMTPAVTLPFAAELLGLRKAKRAGCLFIAHASNKMQCTQSSYACGLRVAI